MKRVLVTVAAVAATAVVGTAVPLGLSLTAAGSEQPPSPVTGTVTRADKRDAQGPPAWAHQKPGEQRDAAKARWKQERRAHLDAWKAWKKEQQKAWRAQDSHDGPPPWAGGPWRTGPRR